MGPAQGPAQAAECGAQAAPAYPKASRAAVRAALERTLGQGCCQLGCAGVGHSGDAGAAAASMQPAGEAAVPLGSPVQGSGQLGRVDVGLRPTGGAGMAAACPQPAGDAAVALGGLPRATGRAAMVQSAVLQSGEARPRLDLARFPLGVPSAAEMAYARELSAAKGERTAAGARPFTMLSQVVQNNASIYKVREFHNVNTNLLPQEVPPPLQPANRLLDCHPG